MVLIIVYFKLRYITNVLKIINMKVYKIFLTIIYSLKGNLKL